MRTVGSWWIAYPEDSDVTETSALPRILIVDDSRMVRASIIKNIKGRFDVREEGDGEAGWQTLLLDAGIQVLISDLTMPKLDGYGLLQRVRDSSISRIRDLPVIMISGDEDESARNRAKECGATDFITKGIGTAELLARLEALMKLAQARNDLENMSKQVMIDPESGLSTGEYLKQQGRQALALAQRRGDEVSVIVVEILSFDDLVAKYGRAVGDQLIRQFRTVLSKRVRLEDTVSQTGTSQFSVVCPGIDPADALAFTQRLDQTIRGATISYRGERVEIGLKFGIANSRDDDWQTLTHLLQLAQERAGPEAGETEGQQFVQAEVVEAPPPPPPMEVEDAIALLRSGENNQVKPHLALLAVKLLPLLKLIDTELKLGLKVEEAEIRLQELL